MDALRILGSLLILVGHWIMFNKNRKIGLSLRIVGGLVALPFSIQQGYIDLVVLGAAFSLIDIKELNRSKGGNGSSYKF